MLCGYGRVSTRNQNTIRQEVLMKELGVESGVTDATMHCLRHSYTTRLFEVVIDIKVVSEQLWHKTVKIRYDTYVHVMPEQKI